MVSYRATFLLTALVVIAAAFTNRMTASEHQAFLNWIGSSVDDFDLHHVLTMPVATFVQSSPGVRWHMVLLVAAPLAVLEWGIGSLRALVTFVLSDWISAPVTLLVLWFLASLGSSQAAALLSSADAGSSAAAHGTIAAACFVLPEKVRNVALALLFIVSVAAFTFERWDAAVAHFIACFVGIGFGLLWQHRQLGNDRRLPAASQAIGET